MIVIRVIYYALVVTCIGISLYLTYFGFESTFNELTLPFTIVIGLVLFAADFLIQRYREIGRSVALPLVLFVIGATFSSISNFNFLYTNFMRGDVTAETLRSQFDLFRDDLTETRSALSSISAVRSEREKRNMIGTELSNMLSQATDPSRPGCGERCREHISRINSLLTVPPTDLAIPANPDNFRQFFDAYSTLVYDSLDAEPSATIFVAVRNLQRDIEEALSRFSSSEAALQSEGLRVLVALSDTSLEIERRANAILPASSPVDHTFIDPGLGRLGEIIFSLQNGFIERPNIGATILSFIASVIVDVLPVIFALIAFRPGVNIDRATPGSRGQRASGLL